MIQAENLIKTFSRTEKKNQRVEFNAVDNISLTLKPGEILGVLGPNGAGKTTLLRMLGRLMQPTSGQVSIRNQAGELISDDIAIKHRIGYLSNNTKLYPRLSGRELLQLFGSFYDLSKKTIDARIEEIAKVLELESFLDNRIEQMSTGQTQRISIARCLLHSPDTYIFDEPTLGLDIISSQSIIAFMKSERNAGKSVLYSTHYMEEAEYLCDRIIMIHKGQIIAEGSPEELRNMTGTTNLRETFLSLIASKEGETNEKN